MVNPNRFYTYAYLRKDKTPYYIGKGQKNRIYSTNRKTTNPPNDKTRIIFLKQNLTEEEAFKHEIYMIAVLGRKDLGTGILHNRTNGGEGTSGRLFSEEQKRNISNRRRNIKFTEEHRKNISEAIKGKNHPQYKKPLTEEHKKRISEKNKNNKGFKNGKSKLWKITFSDGKTIILCGLANWCKENNYNRSHIVQISKKNRKKHKNVINVENIKLNDVSLVEVAH
jgi:hypothetical protein